MLFSRGARKRLLSGILRPVAVLCLKRSVGLPEIVEQLKYELIRAAAEEIIRGERKRCVSTVAAMTGITRREVNRIMNLDDQAIPVPNIAGRVLVQWSSDRRYCGKSGKPRVLSHGRDDSDFSKLVRSVSKDTSPAAILFELERLNAVRVKENGVYLLQTEAMYRSDPIKAAGLIMRNIESLVLAGEENLDPNQEVRNLFFRTEFDHLAEKDIPKIKKWILQQGVEFHERIRAFLAKLDRDFNPQLPELPPEKRRKIVVGSFSLMSESAIVSQNLFESEDIVKRV